MYSCDLHDGDMTDDVQTVSFGLDGQSYELDACEEHRGQLQDAFAPYVGAARKAGGSRRLDAPARVARDEPALVRGQRPRGGPAHPRVGARATATR